MTGVPASNRSARSHAAHSDRLVFDRVSKWYGAVIGVNEVTVTVPPGIVGLVGPNGAGKSTLMKLATGQLRPSLGSVTVGGVDAWHANARWLVGYCPETDAFYEEMSGREFVYNMARLHGYGAVKARRRTEEVLEAVGMADRSRRRLRGYSKGMRQRIKLAQALVHDPDLLILDEPFNGIDPPGRDHLQALFKTLADQGKTLLISSHQLEELERFTEQVLVMVRGRLVAQGTIERIRSLFEDHPFTVRIDVDRPRQLAAALLQVPEVIGVDLGGDGRVFVRARQPDRFFQTLGSLINQSQVTVEHLETTDCSARAILDYLTRNGA